MQSTRKYSKLFAGGTARSAECARKTHSETRLWWANQKPSQSWIN